MLYENLCWRLLEWWITSLPRQVVYFVNSGSEANDLAMMMARLHTQSFDIVTLRNAYHGASPYTVGLTAHGTWKFPFANGFGIHNVRAKVMCCV